MKRKVLVLLMCLVLMLSMAVPALAAEGDVTVTVYATNDIHGVVEASDSSIGLAKVAAIASGENSILVDAGDATQGASFATVSEGEDVISVMNAAGYDVMAAGNHEFDYGLQRLLSNAKAAEFPILSANVTANGASVLDGSAVITRAGHKIGFIGLTTTATISNANPAGLEGVKFDSELTAAKREIAALSGKADAIILICHMGDNSAAVDTTSKELLEGLTDAELEPVVAVIDGHSHTVEDGTAYVRGDKSVPIIQSETQLTNLGCLTVTFSGGAATAKGSVMSCEDAAAWTPDAALSEAAKAAEEKVNDTLSKIGEAQKGVLGQKLIDNLVPVWGGNVFWDWSENRIVETAYGDLVSDAFASKAQAFAKAQGLNMPVIAVENGGGIAQPMAQGEVTYGDILGAFNHGNAVWAISVTPAELYAALEVGLTMTGQDETGYLLREKVSGSFLQVSGFTYTYDPAGESGTKVTDVTLVDGTKLARDDAKTALLLATNNYVASSIFKADDTTKLGELGGEDMAVRDWLMVLTDNGTVPLNYPVSAGRIRYANDKAPESYTVSVPVVDEYGRPAAGLTVHYNVDCGEYTETVTDSNGAISVTVPSGPQVIGLKESGTYVYVNNYSGSGTVTTRDGYCVFSFAVTTGKPAFTDVTANMSCYDAVNTVFKAGLMNGIGGGLFDPNGGTTRAMAAQVLYRLSGSDPVDFLMTFTDVKEGAWYTEGVRWAASKKLIDGVGGAFLPTGSVTREQFAKMIYSYQQTQGGAAVDADLAAGYSDSANISDWAVEAMSWCLENGVVNAVDGRLSPKAELTRADLAAMLAAIAG